MDDFVSNGFFNDKFQPAICLSSGQWNLVSRVSGHCDTWSSPPRDYPVGSGAWRTNCVTRPHRGQVCFGHGGNEAVGAPERDGHRRKRKRQGGLDHAIGRDQSYYLLQGDGFSGNRKLHLYGADCQSNQYLHPDGVDERNHLSNQCYRNLFGGNVTRRNHHGDPGWPAVCAHGT